MKGTNTTSMASCTYKRKTCQTWKDLPVQLSECTSCFLRHTSDFGPTELAKLINTKNIAKPCSGFKFEMKFYNIKGNFILYNYNGKNDN